MFCKSCFYWDLEFSHIMKSEGHHEEVYYESIKRELNKRHIFECQCDVRLNAKTEGSTRLTYTRWHEEP